MAVFYFEADCPEWHKLRSEYITGSDLASLFGLNPQRSITDVIAEKFEGSKFQLLDILELYLYRGRMFESAHFIALSEKGYNVRDAAPFLQVKYVTHEKCKLATSMDGILEEDGVEYPLEVKTTGRSKWNKLHLPSERRVFFIQNIAQSMCLEVDRGFLNCLQAVFPHNNKLYGSKIDKDLEKLIVKTVNRFWKEKTKFTVDADDKASMVKFLKTNTGLIYETEFVNPHPQKCPHCKGQVE